MNVIMVKGFRKTGKTTTCVAIIGELVRRGYTVATIKDIHFEDFALDTEDEDTGKHAKAGAQVVVARGKKETDILHKWQMDARDILTHLTQEWVVCEGDCGLICPNIVTGRTEEQLEERRDENTFAFAGIISGERREYDGIPIVDGTTEIERLVDLIEEHVRKDD